MPEPTDARVHLVQLLCPRRHCIMAVAYTSDEGTKDQAIAQLDARRVLLGLNPWCGICGSRELTYEDRATPFTTLDEALTDLRKMEEANLESRRYLDQHGLSYDSQPRN